MMFQSIGKSRLILFACLAITVLSCYYASRLRFNYDFETFFPDNDPALPFFQQHRKTFGFDNEFILIALANDKGIFQKDFLGRIYKVSGELKKIPFIAEVASPVTLKRVSLGGIGALQIPLLHYDDPSLYVGDSAYIYSSPQWKNNFFSADGRSLCLFLRSIDGLSKQKSDSLAGAITSCVGRYFPSEAHFGGRIFAQAVFLKKLQSQFFMFVLISFVLISLLLWLTYKRIGAVVLPVSLIVLSLIFTFGIMGLIGQSIDIMAIMIPSMVFVAGMSDVVHFYTKYTDDINRKKDPALIFRQINKEVAGPTFLTLISTIAGFLSLCYSGVKPIRDFGIFTSVGITIAFILTYTYLPAMLKVFPAKGRNRKPSNEGIDRGMQRLFTWVIRHGKQVSGITVILLMISFFGISRIKSNQSLLEDLPEHEPMKQDLLFFEKNFGGVRPFELAVKVIAKDKTIWDPEVIRQLDKVERFVAAVYQPGFLVSPASLVKGVNLAYDDGYFIPADTSDLGRDISLVRKNKHRKQVEMLISTDAMCGRVSGKINDAGTLIIDRNNAMLRCMIKNYTDTNCLRFTITGTANLIDVNNHNLVTNTMQGLLTGVGILALITLILHRSLRMMIIFLIPNLVPLILMGGIMGLTGIELKSSTAIFFSIAFGIATDDTIHFISRFRLEMKRGLGPLRAFRQTYFETGKAVFLTTLILVGGFISLIISDFESIFLFGVLTAITLVVALISEIFLLPALLTFMFKRKKSDGN